MDFPAIIEDNSESIISFADVQVESVIIVHLPKKGRKMGKVYSISIL